jgi:hypothetical protein
VRRLMRDLREVRMAKLRAGVDVLVAGGGFKMNGVGGMEVAEGRAFIGGVIDGLRYESRNLCTTGWAREDQCFADDGFVTGRLAPHASSSAATGNARSARMAIQLRLMTTTTKWICRSHVSGSPDSARESPADMERPWSREVST